MTRMHSIMPVFVLITLTACVAGKTSFPGIADAVPLLPRSAKQHAPISSPPLTESERAFTFAIDAYKSGNADATLFLSRQVAEQYPNTPWYKRSLFLTERALILLDRPSEAAAAMLRVQAEYPELADYAVFLLADYYSTKARHSEAAALYEQVAERYPKSSLVADAAFRRAQALFESSAYPRAGEAYEKFLRDYPRSELAPAAGLGLGRALTAEANLTQAVLAYQDVWVRYPGNLNDRDVEKALAELKAGGVDVPEISLAGLYERGRNLFRGSQNDKAVETFTKFLDRDPNTPNRPDALFRTGVALFNLGRRSEAAVILEKMVKAYPADTRTPEALYWIGKSYSRLGEWDRGVKTFQTLLDAFPESEWADDALFLSGNIYRETNDTRKALSFYARLVQEYPESALADSAIWWRDGHTTFPAITRRPSKFCRS